MTHIRMSLHSKTKKQININQHAKNTFVGQPVSVIIPMVAIHFWNVTILVCLRGHRTVVTT